MEMNLSERLANWLIKNWKDICFIEIFILIGWSILMYALYLLDEKYMQKFYLLN